MVLRTQAEAGRSPLERVGRDASPDRTPPQRPGGVRRLARRFPRAQSRPGRARRPAPPRPPQASSCGPRMGHPQAPGGRRPADAGLGVGAGDVAGAGLRRAARSGLDAGDGRVYGDGDGRSHHHEPGGVGGVDIRHLGDADTGRGAGCGRDGDAGVRAAGVEPGAGRGGQRCAGVQRPVGEAGPAAAAAGPCAGDGGGGRPGQRAPGGDLDGGGHRHGLHGAVDVGQPGLQHRRPAGHGHDGVDHTLHDSQPHQRHGIHRAGDRDPDGRHRRPAVGGDDGDAESAAATSTAAAGPCAGDGGGGRPGQRAAGGDLDVGGHRHGLHGAVDVGRRRLQHRRPAGHGHVGVATDSQPHQRHGIHGAGDRDPRASPTARPRRR